VCARGSVCQGDFCPPTRMRTVCLVWTASAVWTAVWSGSCQCTPLCSSCCQCSWAMYRLPQGQAQVLTFFSRVNSRGDSESDSRGIMCVSALPVGSGNRETSVAPRVAAAVPVLAPAALSVPRGKALCESALPYPDQERTWSLDLLCFALLCFRRISK
jgi:hypothetical protein